MILLPFLFLTSGAILFVAINHLNQSVTTYYDFVALTMVLGGSTLIALVLLPWEYRSDIFRAFKFLLRKEKNNFHQVLKDSVELLQKRTFASNKAQWLYQEILVDGLELIQLSIHRDKISELLSDRIYHTCRRWRKIGSAIRSLAKYPPALGLVGTVLGLVNIMKSLAGASDAGRLGGEMSIALVATMYGLLFANMIINPIDELLLKKVEEEEEYAEIAMQAVLLLKDEASVVESFETLNSMVGRDDRLVIDEVAARDVA